MDQLAPASSSSSSLRRENLLHSYLHAVRKKSPAKPVKKPVGMQPSDSAVLPKVYKVDPVDFRELVQRLTGAPQFKSPVDDVDLQDQPPSTKPLLTRRNIAVPSLLTSQTVCHGSSSDTREVPSELNRNEIMTKNGAAPRFPDSTTLQSPSYSWCSFADLLSPNLFSSLEPIEQRVL